MVNARVTLSCSVGIRKNKADTSIRRFVRYARERNRAARDHIVVIFCGLTLVRFNPASSSFGRDSRHRRDPTNSAAAVLVSAVRLHEISNLSNLLDSSYFSRCFSSFQIRLRRPKMISAAMISSSDSRPRFAGHSRRPRFLQLFLRLHTSPAIPRGRFTLQAAQMISRCSPLCARVFDAFARESS